MRKHPLWTGPVLLHVISSCIHVSHLVPPIPVHLGRFHSLATMKRAAVNTDLVAYILTRVRRKIIIVLLLISLMTIFSYFFIFSLTIYVLCICVPVFVRVLCVQEPMEARRGIDGWGLNPGLLQEQ